MFLFSLKSALLLVLLFLPYRVLLHEERFFHFNRLVLVGVMLVSLVLPLVNVAPLSLDSVPAVNSVQSRLVGLGVPIETGALPVGAPRGESLVWRLFSWLYAVVAVVLVAGRLWGFVRLKRIVRHGCIEFLRRDGLNIYIHAGDAAPFSWGRSIVIGQGDYESHGREILLHETGHIRLHHSADVVLLTLCQMLQWFNPFVWMMGRRLAELHEYEADRYVLRRGVNVRDYQRLLLQKAVGSRKLASVQGFSEAGQTARRIKMMSAAPDRGVRRLRIVYMPAVVLLALSIFATSGFNEFRAEVVEKDPTVPFIAQMLNSLVPTPDAGAEVVESSEAAWQPRENGEPRTAEEVAQQDAPTLRQDQDRLKVPADLAALPAASAASPVPQHVQASEPVEAVAAVASSAVIGEELASISPPEVRRFSVPSVAARPVTVTVAPESERLIDLGYGKQKKKLVSSHVNGYSGEELMKTGFNSLPEAIACKVPGLRYVSDHFVYRNSHVYLFFVDGVITRSITYISLGDVDYVEFDSEAYIYGTLGNYAIRVHTKR